MILLVVTIIIVGALLYLAETLIPMDPTVRLILRVVVIIALVLYILSAFGLLQFAALPVPRLDR
jgi:hypothetical protein